MEAKFSQIQSQIDFTLKILGITVIVNVYLWLQAVQSLYIKKLLMASNCTIIVHKEITL